MVVLIFVPTKKRKPKAVVAKYGLSTNLIFYKSMKNLELELSGVQSLSTQEMKSVDGGDFGTVAAVLGIISFGIYLYNEGGDFVDGYNETRR